MLKIFKKHPHWKNVESVLTDLSNAGYEAWLAGGCVRDGILQKKPNDFDIATNAHPDQVQDIFPKSLEVGKSFGVVILPFDGFQVEVASFRTDGTYIDGRHPDQVIFSSPEEDAMRRDFTINAMFFDVSTNKVHDFVGGLEDLRNRRVRCVGDAHRRFAEDQLRILRALRFSAQLDFDLEESTWSEIKIFLNPLAQVSRERVIEEMEKLLLCQAAEKGLALLVETPLFEGVFLKITDELRPAASQEWLWVSEFNQQKAPVEFLWALLLYRGFLKSPSKIKDWVEGQPFSRKKRSEILNVLNLSKTFFKDSTVRYEDLVIRFDRSHLSAWYFDFLLRITDLHGPAQVARVGQLQKLYVSNLNADGFLTSPLLRGSDLVKMGIEKGPRMGAFLEFSYQLQIRECINSKSELMIHPELKAYTSKGV